MNFRLLMTALVGSLATSCACEIQIASSDVPPQVVSAFTRKYTDASNVEWEIEKEDGKLYYEVAFKVNGKRKEAYFRPDGTFSKEE